MKRSTVSFGIATAVLVTLVAADPASAGHRKPRTQTVTAQYSRSDGVYAGGSYLASDFLTGLVLGSTEVAFRVPNWARMAQVSVNDTTGLPVQFAIETDHSAPSPGCETPVSLALTGGDKTTILDVAAIYGVLNACANHLSIPTTGRVTVTFSG